MESSTSCGHNIFAVLEKHESYQIFYTVISCTTADKNTEYLNILSLWIYLNDHNIIIIIGIKQQNTHFSSQISGFPYFRCTFILSIFHTNNYFQLFTNFTVVVTQIKIHRKQGIKFQPFLNVNNFVIFRNIKNTFVYVKLM